MKQRSEERRKGQPEAPVFGELLLEANWQPEDFVPPEVDAWLRSRGVIEDRRRAGERRGPARK